MEIKNALPVVWVQQGIIIGILFIICSFMVGCDVVRQPNSKTDFYVFNNQSGGALYVFKQKQKEKNEGILQVKPIYLKYNIGSVTMSQIKNSANFSALHILKDEECVNRLKQFEYTSLADAIHQEIVITNFIKECPPVYTITEQDIIRFSDQVSETNTATCLSLSETGVLRILETPTEECLSVRNRKKQIFPF